MIKAIATFLAELFGWGRESAARSNTAEMLTAKRAQEDADIKARAAQLTAKGDLDAERKALAE